MKNLLLLIIGLLFVGTSFGQLSPTPCAAGPLPLVCAPNTVVLNSTDGNSGVSNPIDDGFTCTYTAASSIYDVDTWFTTTVDANGDVSVYAAGSDPVLGIYTGACASLTLVACDDDGGNSLDALVTASGLPPGEVVWIRVWDYTGLTSASATYTIAPSGGTPPANDDCASPEALVLNAAVVPGSGYCSTVEVGDWNDCEANTEGNVWYSFTLPSDGVVDVNITGVACFGSGNGVDVSVFSGTCAAFTSLDCSVSVTSTDQITFSGLAGVTYTVMIDGDNSGGANSLCDFDIDVDFLSTVPECGTVDFHATINASPYSTITPFPSTMSCTDDWIYLSANDSGVAGNYISPALLFVFNSANDNNDDVKIFSGGTSTVSSGTLLYSNDLVNGQELTVYGDHLDPGTDYYIEICDANAAQPVAWEVLNGATAVSLGLGSENGGAGCRRYGPFSPTGIASWTSTAPAASFGTYNNGEMWFNPALSGPGTFDFTYDWDDGGSCTGSATKSITVTTPYSFTSLTYATVCENSSDVVPVLVADAGGVYSSPTLGTSLNGSTGTVTPDLVGVHTVIYTIGISPCVLVDSSTIEILPLDSASFTYASGTYCLTGVDPSPDLGTNTTLGGEFTISGAGVINVNTGEIDLSASGVAGSPYTVTYNTANLAGPCPVSETFVVAITLAPSAVFSYDQATYCQDAVAPVLTFGVGASGGIFSISPFSPSTAGLTLNTANGAVVLTTSASGVYTVYNLIAAAGGCAAALDSTTIEVLDADSALFSYSPGTYCSSGTDPLAVMDGNATLGGLFTISSPGVLLNTSTGEVDLDASGAGVFSVYYNTPIGNDCPAVDSVAITILSNPVADAPLDVTACDSYTLPALSPGNNYFSAINGGGTALAAGNIIIADSTIYVYAETGTVPNCTDGNSFVVTINLSPNSDAPLDVTACDTYTLPALSPGNNYFSATNGGGTALTAGDVITTDSTIYVYAESGTTPNCTDGNSFLVTINPLPVANSIVINTCDIGGAQGVFDLTAAAVNVNTGIGDTVVWFTNTGLTLFANPVDSFVAGNTIVYAQVIDTITGCSDTASIYLVVDPLPTVSSTTINECDNGLEQATFNLSNEDIVVNGGVLANTVLWFEDSLGATSIVTPGAFVTSNDTVYAVVTDGITSCVNITPVFLTIDLLPIAIDDSVQICEDVFGSQSAAGVDLTILEPILNGGANDGIVWYDAGFVLVTNPNSTIVDSGDVFNAIVDNGTCVDTAQIFYHVTGTIVLTNPNDTLCEGIAGSGSVTGVDLATYNTSIFIVGATPPIYNWYSDNGYSILIPSMNNFTIDSALTDTMYVEVISGNCSERVVVTFTILPLPVADAPTNLVACDSIALPALSVGNYFTQSGAMGTALFAGDFITSTQQVFVYAESGSVPCMDENNFTITINASPIADAPVDVSACDTYTLPALSAGNNYFSATNGGGTALTAGDAITTDSTIYVYAESGTTPNCTDGNSFVVTINASPVADDPVDIEACESYTLPVLSAGNNYFTATNGGGVALAAGFDIITLGPNTIFVYSETGAVPNCTDENSFVVTINARPVADTPAPETECGSYILPALSAGNNYFTATGGGGTPLFAGDAITTVGANTIFVYATIGTTPSCADESSFIVTINASPVAVIDYNPPTGGIPLEVDFDGSGSLGTIISYSWDFGNGLTSLDTITNSIYDEIGIYTITLIVNNGTCSDTATVEFDAFGISAVLIPNVFTPNGDGENDIFTVEGTNLESIEGEIFNRWGQKIFSWDNLKGYWDGRTLAGTVAPDGTYFFVIKAVGVDGQEYFKKGAVSLIQ